MVRNFVAQEIPLGKTREQLAREIGISRVHLQRIISGKQLPSVEIALRIATALQKPVEMLFQLEEPWYEGKRRKGRKAK